MAKHIQPRSKNIYIYNTKEKKEKQLTKRRFLLFSTTAGVPSKATGGGIVSTISTR